MIDKLTMRLLLAFLTLFYIPNTNADGCSIKHVSDISFSAYDVFSLSDNNSTGSFEVKCSGNDYNLISTTLSTGLSGNAQLRTMKYGSEILNYNLYTDETYTTIWQNRNVDEGTKYIYGKIPAGQDASVGSYSDSITITITF